MTIPKTKSVPMTSLATIRTNTAMEDQTTSPFDDENDENSSTG